MTEVKTIALHFPKTGCLGLDGSFQGQQVFYDQVAPHLSDDDFERGFLIQFPDFVTVIGRYFIEGLISPIIYRIGIDGVMDRVRFAAGTDDLTNAIYQDVSNLSNSPYLMRSMMSGHAGGVGYKRDLRQMELLDEREVGASGIAGEEIGDEVVVIELEFQNPEILALGGSDQGREVYEEQLVGRLTDEVMEKGVLIKFPPSTLIIGSCFMRALMEPVIKAYGLDVVRQKIRFETSSEELTMEVHRDVC